MIEEEFAGPPCVIMKITSKVLNAHIPIRRPNVRIDDVISGICEKMVRRHPWVFGDAKINSAEEGEALWTRIKMQDKAKKP